MDDSIVKAAACNVLSPLMRLLPVGIGGNVYILVRMLRHAEICAGEHGVYNARR